MDSPEIEAQRRAELLVSDWHRHYRLFIGGGAGLDHEARRSLIVDIAAAIAGPLGEIERLKEDAALTAVKPARRKGSDHHGLAPAAARRAGVRISDGYVGYGQHDPAHRAPDYAA